MHVRARPNRALHPSFRLVREGCSGWGSRASSVAGLGSWSAPLVLRASYDVRASGPAGARGSCSAAIREGVGERLLCRARWRASEREHPTSVCRFWASARSWGLEQEQGGVGRTGDDVTDGAASARGCFDDVRFVRRGRKLPLSFLMASVVAIEVPLEALDRVQRCPTLSLAGPGCSVPTFLPACAYAH
ncbi:hypothetical protein PYCCODRAFT_1160829 [Trametes coccinea BRFM310]|uniref:Uncharacterized protein n=1 Tax=Trametes coccinea (strain BRFM310) TaxID=1353009 RepID=A0A1Y2IX20_TRAC3|nr:hypothetical protein PYCCODRAFT_1160829 [Trametes coccinea BRFM310]